MSDLIEAVAKAICEAWVLDESVGWADSEPWRNTYRRLAQAALDAVTATHTIVELPEPALNNPLKWNVIIGGESEDVYQYVDEVDGTEMFCISGICNITRDEAKSLASALLAAATVAERTEKQ